MSNISTHQIIETLSAHTTSPDMAYEAFVGLRSRYDEPWRHHHDFEHPRAMFDELLYHKHLAKDLGAIAWSIMYHDAIYDPMATGGRNEELSAQLAERELPRIARPELSQTVARFTRATADHRDSIDDSDFDLFMDLDLTILGASPKRYTQYSADIRAEYAHVPDDTYRIGRTAILTSLVNRIGESSIFKTPELREIYESQAQENIAGELNALQKQ